MKAFTDLDQSRKLVEFLPIESADMYYFLDPTPAGNIYHLVVQQIAFGVRTREPEYDKGDIPCWSLAALLEELNRNYWNVSLKCCGAEWDMTYDDGERYISISSDYAIDACVAMIKELHKLKML